MYLFSEMNSALHEMEADFTTSAFNKVVRLKFPNRVHYHPNVRKFLEWNSEKLSMGPQWWRKKAKPIQIELELPVKKLEYTEDELIKKLMSLDNRFVIYKKWNNGNTSK